MEMRRLHWACLMVSLCVLLELNCSGPEAQQAATESSNEGKGAGVMSAAQLTLDCPHDFRVTPPNSTREIAIVPLAGAITNVVGYHDCQRLVINQGRAYGPLVAVFASSRLASIETDLDAQSHGVGVAAAEIYSYDGSYEPLGIEPGFNCLYLSRGQGLEARLVPVGYDERACLEPLGSNDQRGKELQVHAAAQPGLAQGDYPPVARWDWDRANLKQYIGAACGAAWCEIGEIGFQASPSLSFGGVGADRVYRVKGWYDEQVLAVANADGSLRPSGVRGALVPAPGLGELDDTAAFQQRWVHVATAVLDGPSAEYKRKLNFDQGTNLVYLCHGNRSGCIPVSTLQPTCTSEGAWWQKTVSATGESAFACVTFRDHSGLGVRVPTTARWRWLANDESTWFSCPTGCCTKQ